MEEFLKSVYSPYWWLSVVFVGLVLNIASSYIQSVLNITVGKISSKFRNYSRKSKDKRKAKINSIISGEIKYKDLRSDEMRFRFKSLMNFLVAVIMWFLYLSMKLSFLLRTTNDMEWSDFNSLSMRVTFWVTLLPIFSAFSYWNKADSLHSLLLEVKEYENKDKSNKRGRMD